MSTALELARPIPPQAAQVIRADEHFMPVLSLARAIERYDAIVEFTKKIMKAGKDYGEIPGTEKKPTLLKPGAEKLCNFFGLTPKFEVVEKKEVWDGDQPFFYYWYKCTLWRGDHFMGEGEGSANSYESKHRYRWVQENQLPPGADKAKFESRDGSVVEMDFAIRKAETTGKYGKPPSYWQAFNDAINNGTAVRTTKETKRGKELAWKIGAPVYRVPNPDIADQVNTLQKMGQKRSFIAATLIGCNASEYFTQDLEDLEPIAEYIPEPPDLPPAPEAGRMPDTGGHPVGTQAAADHVGRQKIEELEKQMNARRQEPPPTPAPEEIPPEVQALWARMKDGKSSVAVLEELRSSLCEALGQDAGYELYHSILVRHGAPTASKFTSTRPARHAARDLLNALKEASSSDPLGVSMSDIPEFENPGGFPDGRF